MVYWLESQQKLQHWSLFSCWIFLSWTHHSAHINSVWEDHVKEENTGWYSSLLTLKHTRSASMALCVQVCVCVWRTVRAHGDKRGSCPHMRGPYTAWYLPKGEFMGVRSGTGNPALSLQTLWVHTCSLKPGDKLCFYFCWPAAVAAVRKSTFNLLYT